MESFHRNVSQSINIFGNHEANLKKKFKLNIITEFHSHTHKLRYRLNFTRMNKEKISREFFANERKNCIFISERR